MAKRGRRRVGWWLARHLLEMVAAMLLGMAVFSVAVSVLGEPPGYQRPLVGLGWMGAAMSLPMVAWMRYRGHSWAEGGEMAAAMLGPMIVLVLSVQLGALALDGHALMMIAHTAMIGGMVALMIFRRDRYGRLIHGSTAYRPSSEWSMPPG